MDALRLKKIHLALLLTFSVARITFAAPTTLTYQGRILKADGSPLEYQAVSFIFQVTNPAGSCILYQEQLTGFDMTNSKGIFDVSIGSGTVSWPNTGSVSILDTFNNSATFSCGACSGYSCLAGSSTYHPINTDGRLLRVQFHDGNGWKAISPDTAIRSVPFAGFAQSASKLGTNAANDFILKNDVNNPGSGSSSCDSGNFLTWNASTQKFGCAAVSGATGGTVTNVTASGPLSVTNGTSTPNITLQAATSSQNGYLSSADWTTFNNKIGAASNFAGDVSGTYATISVDKLKGTALNISAISAGQFLKYNGTNWVNSTISQSDISGLNTTLSGYISQSQFPASCSTNQTLTFLSPTGSFSCSAISINGSQVSGTITANLTGAASANVLKTGDSMSGHLTFSNTKGSVYTDTGSNTATITGPSSAIGTSYVLRLPTSQSSGTQALVNDGSGNLSWQSLSSGSVTSINATSPLSSSGGATPTLSLGGLNGLGGANQILGMNSGATGYEYKTVNGTTNQVTVTNAANSITLTTPQNIHTGATPTFNGMTLSGMSAAGFVKNNASGVLSGGNSISASSDLSGVLPVAHGGTGSTSFANYSAIVSNGSGDLTAVAGSTSGSILNWTVTGPTWTTASFPSTTTANQLLYSSANNVVRGLASANNSILTTDASGVPSFTAKSGDLFSQYALLAGRAGGQTLYGGTASGNGITIDSTSNATKGNIILNPAGGNVGIGTTNPGQKLTVNGVIESTSGGVKFPDGSIQTTAYTAGTGGAWSTLALSNTADFDPQCEYILNGVRASWVTSTAIGVVTNSVSGSTTAFWRVVNSSNKNLTLSADDNYNNNLYYGSSATSSILFRCGSGSTGQWTTAGSDIYYSTGKVGIGTAAPSSPLHVLNALAANDAPAVQFRLGAGTDATLGPLSFIVGHNPSANGASRYSYIGTGDNSSMRPLILNTNGMGAFGNVGIGTSSPSQTLDVVGNIKATQLCIGADCRSTWPSAGSGTVTSVTAGSGLTGGAITTSGTIAVDTGTTANKIVQLDAAAKLPTVDGSALTNVNATKLAGTSLAISSLTSGNYLKYNGTAWVNSTLSSADLSDASSLIKASQMPANCAAGQTLTFSSPSGSWTCSNIIVTASNFGSQTANTFLAAPNGSSGAPSFRTIASADLPAGTLSGAGTSGYVPYYSAASTLTSSNLYYNGTNLGVGTTSPGSPLTVNGVIESKSGGIKFPDGTIQTTSAASGTNNTMISGWPDAIRCAWNSSGDPMILYFYTGAHSAYYDYMAVYGGGTYMLRLNANGTYYSNNGLYNGTGYNCVSQTLAQLTANGQTFNFTKGPAAQWLQNGTSAYYNAGNVGIGTSTPTVAMDVNGAIRAGGSATVTACGLGQSNGEGSQRYNYTSHQMEYCNGSTWVGVGQKTLALTITGNSSATSSSIAFNVSNTALNTLLGSNPTTSSVTIPVTGIYDISAVNYLCTTGANTYSGASIYVNGTLQQAQANVANSCGGGTVRLALQLTAGDVVLGGCFNNQGLAASCTMTVIKMP